MATAKTMPCETKEPVSLSLDLSESDTFHNEICTSECKLLIHTSLVDHIINLSFSIKSFNKITKIEIFENEF